MSQDTNNLRAIAEMQRAARVSEMRQNKAADRDPRNWAGQQAAIYCRISKINDDDQTGVERQEVICREVADRLKLPVPADGVFRDPNRSAWQRKRKRPQWDALLEAIATGQFRHVVIYHADRLMRQPADLEELLRIADEHHVILHGEAGGRDLSDPDDRFILRIEVAHACRSSDDASRRIKAKQEERAANGLPHGGRKYGYDATGKHIIEHEAAVVRAIFNDFLDGRPNYDQAKALREAGQLTAWGKEFQTSTVYGILRSAYLAGLRVFRGEIIGPGDWPALIDPGTFYEVQERMDFRAEQWHEGQTRRVYLLRGVVRCADCKKTMTGMPSASGRGAYQCRNKPDGASGRLCGRRFAGPELESFVLDSLLGFLENLDIENRPVAVKMSEEDADAAEADRRQLADLETMWIKRLITTAQYERMLTEIKAEIAKRRDVKPIRPAATVLRGLTGPNTRATWKKLADAEEYERMNAVIRFAIDAVMIAPSTVRGKLDYGRISIRPNEI